MFGRIIRVALAGAVALTLAGSTPASAKDGDVIRRGSCTGSSDWKLKLSPENGKIEVEFEVDSNHAGQVWKVRLFHDGNRIFAGKRTTKAPSGSFEVRVVANNGAGTDSFKGRAARVNGDEVCGGTASIG
jgi:DUF4097 and DUF4098 domain-containing protein YvlB